MIALATGELVAARELFLEVIEKFEREGTATTLGNYLTIPRPTTLGSIRSPHNNSVIWTRRWNSARAVCVRLATAGTT